MKTPLDIEVCKRSADNWRDSEGKEHPKFHAQLKDKSSIWACGQSIDDAIGNLVRCHPDHFNCSISYLEDVSR